MLICEQESCRKCGFYRYWEDIDEDRFSMIGMDKGEPLYWCSDGVGSSGSPWKFGTEAPMSRVVVSKGSPCP